MWLGVLNKLSAEIFLRLAMTYKNQPGTRRIAETEDLGLDFVRRNNQRVGVF
jgi:hypothetical protein